MAKPAKGRPGGTRVPKKKLSGLQVCYGRDAGEEAVVLDALELELPLHKRVRA